MANDIERLMGVGGVKMIDAADGAQTNQVSNDFRFIYIREDNTTISACTDASDTNMLTTWNLAGTDNLFKGEIYPMQTGKALKTITVTAGSVLLMKG